MFKPRENSATQYLRLKDMTPANMLAHGSLAFGEGSDG